MNIKKSYIYIYIISIKKIDVNNFDDWFNKILISFNNSKKSILRKLLYYYKNIYILKENDIVTK